MDELLAVLEDARLAGDRAAIARLGAELAQQLGVAEVGADAHGLWLRLEVADRPERGGPHEPVSHRMRWCWPGRYLQGSPEDEPGRLSSEGPPRLVTITAGFWLGEVPVTQALWRAVMGNNPSQFVSPDRPVEQVSFEASLRFCARLQQRLPALQQRLPALHPRLPTEAEWEYAARAGTATPRYDDLDAIAWHFDNSAGLELEGFAQGTHPVGLKRPNAWGLHDMLGNVDEWCVDRCDLGYHQPVPPEAGEQTDPLCIVGSDRVIRGGSWGSLARIVRAARRSAKPASHHGSYLGLRLVLGRSLEELIPDAPPAPPEPPRAPPARAPEYPAGETRTDARMLLRSLAMADRRAAVWGACLCARTCIDQVHPGEVHPRQALERAEAWVRGHATPEQCEAAAAHANRAVGDAMMTDDPAHYEACKSASAAVSAVSAPRVVPHASPDAPDQGLQGAVADAATYAACVTHAPVEQAVGEDATFEAREEAQDRANERCWAALAVRLQAEPWPLTSPTETELEATPERVRQAWGSLAEDPRTEHTLDALLLAHARAGRIGLDWSDPVQRAVAERLSDEVQLRELLGPIQR